jgi:hypothetical protein
MKRCKYCGAFFIPDPRVGKRQKTCGSTSCKKALKAKNSAKWRQKNPDYYKGDYPRVKKWFSKHPGYLRQYRKDHPQYVEKNRIAQKNRDRRKRLNLDIQAQIKRQVPEITEKLWNSYHLDIQAQIPLKPLESTFLFSTLPCLDIQVQMDKSCRIIENSTI